MKLIKFEIKSERPIEYGSGIRYGSGGRANADSNLTNHLDKWFMDNKIYMLNFKCKTWNKMKNFVTKIESQTISEGLNLTSNKSATVKYSRKAGCSCGCSPGYIVKNDSRYSTRNISVNMEYDITEFEKMIPKFDSLLKKELEAYQKEIEGKKALEVKE